jgi:hypothetical protein
MRREYALFFLFNATGLLIELGVLAAAKYGLGLTSLLALNVAKTGGVLLATLFRFWSYRTFVFQPVPAARDDWDTMAEMDPVAELAESMTELEESQQQSAHRSMARAYPVARRAGAPAEGRPGRQPVGRLAPLDADFTAIDGELEAELAAELHAGSRRSTRR